MSDPFAEACRDAYLALGSAVAELRSMPMRRYSGAEEDMRVSSAKGSITRAGALLAPHHGELADHAFGVEERVHGLGILRALSRPSVWEWIAQLQATRAALAEVMVAKGLDVPDDLPEGSVFERWAGTRAWRIATTALLVLAIAGAGTAALVIVLSGP